MIRNYATETILSRSCKLKWAIISDKGEPINVPKIYL